MTRGRSSAKLGVTKARRVTLPCSTGGHSYFGISPREWTYGGWALCVGFSERAAIISAIGVRNQCPDLVEVPAARDEVSFPLAAKLSAGVARRSWRWSRRVLTARW